MKENTKILLIMIIDTLFFVSIIICSSLGFINLNLTDRISLSSLFISISAMLYPIWRDASARDNTFDALEEEINNNEEIVDTLLNQENLFRSEKGKIHSLLLFQTVAIENAIRLNIFTEKNKARELHRLYKTFTTENELFRIIRDPHLKPNERFNLMKTSIGNMHLIKTSIIRFKERIVIKK